MNRKLAIGIGIAVPAIIGLLVSILCLFLEFYFDERNMTFIMANHSETAVYANALLLPSLSGIIFILTQFIASIILRKKKILSQKESAQTMLTGVIVYILLINIVIPESLGLRFMLEYMPRRELAPQIMALVIIVVSCIFAFICGLVHVLELVHIKRMENKKWVEEYRKR